MRVKSMVMGSLSIGGFIMRGCLLMILEGVMRFMMR
jgi:hypothetical protein